MPTPSFPTLPAFALPLGQERVDRVIRSESEGGYVTTRLRNTRQTSKFKRSWNALSETDLETLMTFFDGDAAGGSAFFTWTSDIDGSSLTVRFGSPPKVELVVPAAGANEAKHRVEIELVEV